MILMGHGAGGRLSSDLISNHFLPRFQSATLSQLADSAVIGDLALTTDSYVVTPRQFPGGDIGRLSIAGTVNDLTMVGARVLGITAAFIIEEGFALQELDAIVASMAETAKEAGVEIVAGDTKVVPRGACDGLFITTSGLGRLDAHFRPMPHRAVVGDAVLCTGTLGDHGMAVMVKREGLGFEGELTSDVAPLCGLLDLLRDLGDDVHVLRDPTRGGAVQSLLEVANASAVRISLEEAAIPVRRAVRTACELLGLDPLYVANEGKALVCVPEGSADEVLRRLRSHPYGEEAVKIGHVVPGRPGCELRSEFGGLRSLRMATGEILPRIC